MCKRWLERRGGGGGIGARVEGLEGEGWGEPFPSKLKTYAVTVVGGRV